jgi:peptidoglycan LD-endopeptidase LytH
MKKRILIIFACILALGLLLPARGVIPVQHATSKDWNKYSYWYFPWGKSGVHKGVDIFAKQGTPVLSSTSGIVLFKGNIKLGGNVIAVIGPKWRLYYYAHLQSTDAHVLEWVNRGERIGTVGTTGNAVGKPAHLHFSIITPIPNPAEITTETQGWKRMFYVNPNAALKD